MSSIGKRHQSVGFASDEYTYLSCSTIPFESTLTFKTPSLPLLTRRYLDYIAEFILHSSVQGVLCGIKRLLERERESNLDLFVDSGTKVGFEIGNVLK
jgi:hypothetical protein